MAKTKFKVKSNVPNVVKELGDEAEERVEEATHRFRNEVLETLSGPRHGKRYKVPGTANTYYTASAPGEPPAQRLGHLRGSISERVTRSRSVFGKDEIRGQVGTDKEYGAKLEFGEYPAGPDFKVKRPWLYPSFKKALPDIRRILGGSRWF